MLIQRPSQQSLICSASVTWDHPRVKLHRLIISDGLMDPNGQYPSMAKG
jgi:hypothetical protein